MKPKNKALRQKNLKYLTITTGLPMNLLEKSRLETNYMSLGRESKPQKQKLILKMQKTKLQT